MSDDFQPIGLGDRARDRISGFTGIVDSVSCYLYGCRRIGVRPEELHDGSPISREYFDETELTILQRGVQEAAVLAPAAAPEPERLRAAGGPPREGAGFRR